MTDEKQAKVETAIDSNVQAMLSRLTLDNAKLQKENQGFVEELKALKKQNVQLASVIETDLKTNAKMNIMAASDFKETDLELLTVEQLQQIEQTLSRTKGVDNVSYKSIRAGNDSKQKGRTTVGDLFGKTRAQILAMGGDF